MKRQQFRYFAVWAASLGLVLCNSVVSSADAFYDTLALEKVKKIALLKPVPSGKPLTDTEDKNLQSMLCLQLHKALTKRLGEHSRFKLVPDGLSSKHLAKLSWTEKDFLTSTRSSRKKQSLVPEPIRISMLASRLNVDAVLVYHVSESDNIGDSVGLHRSKGDLNPLNLKVERLRPHVVSPKVTAYLVNRKGETVWSDTQVAFRPRTNKKTPQSLVADLTEVTLQVAGQVSDSLHRP